MSSGHLDFAAASETELERTAPAYTRAMMLLDNGRVEGPRQRSEAQRRWQAVPSNGGFGVISLAIAHALLVVPLSRHRVQKTMPSQLD